MMRVLIKMFVSQKNFICFLATALILAGGWYCLFPAPVLAGNASLYLAPNSGTFHVGSTFDVSVFVNTGGENINAVKVDLAFDPKKVQIASPTAGKSFISVWISQPVYSNIKGEASFQGGNPSPGVNTSAGLVSTITFRAIAPGETTITFNDSSKVLKDDGEGTNILNSLGRGNYTITLPPPEGPAVFSPTHPDQNKWYKNNNPTFNWLKEEGVTGFSYNLTKDPQAIPDNNPEGDFSSVSFSDIEDGIWYFHLKAQKDAVWGGTSHYLLQIDSSPPAAFQGEITPSTRTSVNQPIVSFITTDALSGLDHFEIKVIDITPKREDKETPFFVEVASPYQLPELEPGKYLVVIRAFDQAQNWRDESFEIEIISPGLSFSLAGLLIWGFFIPLWLLILILFLIILCLLLLHWRHRDSNKEKVRERLDKEKRILRRKIDLIEKNYPRGNDY